MCLVADGAEVSLLVFFKSETGAEPLSLISICDINLLFLVVFYLSPMLVVCAGHRRAALAA